MKKKSQKQQNNSNYPYMGNDKEAEQGKYALYTEKIVVNPFVKYKKIISLLKLLFAAAAFGLVASFVMAVTYPWFLEHYHKQEPAKSSLELGRDELPSDALLTETESSGEKATGSGEKATGSAPTTPNMEDVGAASYVEVIEKIQKSVVRITNTSRNVDSLIESAKDAKDTVGVIIGKLAGNYIILTSSADVKTFQDYFVIISDDNEIRAQYVSADEETGMALLSIDASQILEEEQALVSVAVLDNSYLVKQGDAFIALGKLYGKIKSADHGLVTGITTECGTDNSYGIIDTGIRALFGDYCFLFNFEGNVIGISRVIEEETTLKANGISDLKVMIEKLSSASDITYLGIKGVNVTSTMALRYGLPYGVYLKEVDMDSPAFAAGLQVGDVVTAMNQTPVSNIQAFSAHLLRKSKDEEVSITVKRPGTKEYRELTFTAKLSAR